MSASHVAELTYTRIYRTRDLGVKLSLHERMGAGLLRHGIPRNRGLVPLRA